MSVNLEVKGSLAKCLATENLIIEHRKVSTASFDVDRRILTLPMWEKASATVYDLLVGHEVGHALFTDNIDWTIDYPDVPKDFINVIEDARVERLMKKKYPGLSKTFFSGYNELNDDDFFSTKDENLDNLSLIDRINLYFKIGAFHNIGFTDEENEFVTRITQLETFEDVLNFSRELAEYLKLRKQKVSNMPSPGDEHDATPISEKVESDSESSSQQQEEGNEEGNKMNLDQDSEEQSQGDQDSPEDNDIMSSQEAPNAEGSGGSDPSRTHDVDEMESKTSKSFDEKSKDLVDAYSQETNYVELPEILLDKIIIPNSYIHSSAAEYFKFNQVGFNDVCKLYNQYKQSAVKEVNYLVKEFECKKSADQYARATTARTGVLDTTKLHTYKYNEDLFKKVSVIPDGKNHGLIFILDWSGSMAEWMLDTCKQLFNLIWFCRKVNIPFEVYAFTINAGTYIELQPDHPRIIVKKDNVIVPEEAFRLMNIFTSKSNATELEQQMKHIWACCYSFQKGGMAGYPRILELSGSPLGDSMLALHALIPQFQKANKLQKVNVVFLTDGEGYVNKSIKLKKDANGNEYFGMANHMTSTLRDRKTGRVYPKYYYGGFPQYAKVILMSLKDKFPEVNFINFRITPGRDMATCYRWWGTEFDSFTKVKEILKKEQFITFKQTGFDQFNVLPANSLSSDETFDVEEGASNAKIKSAFVKMLNKKKTNKKLLSSFVDLIA